MVVFQRTKKDEMKYVGDIRDDYPEDKLSILHLPQQVTGLVYSDDSYLQHPTFVAAKIPRYYSIR